MGQCRACCQLSNSDQPPPSSSIDDQFFQCPDCGQKWQRYNTFRHLWRQVNSDADWSRLHQQALQLQYEPW